MKRGVDECEIEGTGMMSAKPKLGTTCSAACQNGGVQYADCSCECLTGYSGKTCELNNLKCGSGLLDPTGKLCVCPTGSPANSVKTPSASAMSQCAGLLLQLSGQSFHGIFQQIRPSLRPPVLASWCSPQQFQISTRLLLIRFCGILRCLLLSSSKANFSFLPCPWPKVLTLYT